jgi:hypothetical protein
LSSSRHLRTRLRTVVVVTLKTGQSFRGVLWDTDKDVWVLKNTDALSGGASGEDVGLDGELIVLTNDIAYAQRP